MKSAADDDKQQRFAASSASPCLSRTVATHQATLARREAILGAAAKREEAELAIAREEARFAPLQRDIADLGGQTRDVDHARCNAYQLDEPGHDESRALRHVEQAGCGGGPGAVCRSFDACAMSAAHAGACRLKRKRRSSVCRWRIFARSIARRKRRPKLALGAGRACGKACRDARHHRRGRAARRALAGGGRACCHQATPGCCRIGT